MDDDIFHKDYLKGFSTDGYVHIIKLSNYSFRKVNLVMVFYKRLTLRLSMFQ